MRKIFLVSKVIHARADIPGEPIAGAAITINPKKTTLEELHRMAEQIKKRGAEAVVFNSFGGDDVRLCFAVRGIIPRLSLRGWRQIEFFLAWVVSVVCGKLYCLKLTTSDSNTLRVLKIRL